MDRVTRRQNHKRAAPARPAPPLGRSANHPGPLNALAQKAQNFSEQSPTGQLARKAQNTPLQAKVFIGKTEMDDPAKGATSSSSSTKNNGGQTNTAYDPANIFTDPWRREFTDKAEMDAYAKKTAQVSVGLIKPMAIWYRIAHLANGQFFVLGENHGAFGYRDFVAESNVTGKVLGEGGNYGPLENDGTKILPNEDVKALTGPDGKAQEFMMENLAPKAYFAAITLYNLLTKGTPTPKTKLKESDWITEHSKAQNKGTAKQSGLAYFKGGPNADTRHYLETNPGAGAYNISEVARKVLLDNAQEMQAAFDQKMPSKVEFDQTRALIQELGKNPLQKDQLKKSLKKAMPELRKISKLEDEKLHQNLGQTGKVAHRTVKPTVHSQKANYYRERAMFQAIISANDQGGFAFAGVGDNHAKALKADLGMLTPPIPVITLEDLRNTHAKPAL